MGDSSSSTWSRTRVKIIKCSHTWTIENFSCCSEEPGEYLESSQFSAGVDAKHKWVLRIYPSGFWEDCTNYISLRMEVCSESECYPVFAKYDVALFNSNQKVLAKRVGKHLYSEQFESSGFHELIRKDVLFNKDSGLLADDELTIQCDVSETIENVDLVDPGKPFTLKQNIAQFPKHLGSFLENDRFSDVILSVKGQEFCAHKVILAACSPVFSAMLQHEMKEKSSNLVHIEDFDGEVISDMLKFMYTGMTPELDVEKAKNVLAASDKYAIGGLKSMCEVYLSTQLTVETAADLLYLADTHNAEQLKKISLNFVCLNSAKVSDTPSWKALFDRRPQLLLEAFKMKGLHESQPPRKKKRLEADLSMNSNSISINYL